ncbi:4Fe-4S domain-containing protein [Streptomyces sp. NPDC058755]|uniref:4Fe-4S domain-containing protein n=1 Tax=unclassified Streptomyces TaxID=2593676 RepID=UPI00367E6157
MVTVGRHSLRVAADVERCIGAGQCVLTEPRVFDQNDHDGRVVLLTDDFDAETARTAALAVETCPVQALSLLPAHARKTHSQEGPHTTIPHMGKEVMTESKFVSHTPETAPEDSKRMVAGAQQKFGFIPAPVAKMAASPELLATFQRNLGEFDKTTLTAMEREVMILTMATFVECHYCVAMHSTMLAGQQAPDELIEALRNGEPLQDARLEAMRQFALAVLETKGGVADQDIDAFLGAGYTQQNALEVVLGIGTYTMSTFANRLTRAELDAPFEKYRWEGKSH